MEAVPWGSNELRASWRQTRRWCEYIVGASRTNDIDPYLVAAVVWWESGGDPLNISSAGAVGLMQVMPSDGLAASHPCNCFGGRPTVAELEDPEFNMNYGARLLVEYVTLSGSVREGLRLYNGHADYDHYADRVLALYQRLKPP